MVSKDQAIGGIIFLVCVLVAIFYVVTLFYPNWVINLGLATDIAAIRFWITAIPVFIALVAVMAIGAWIGWTMATTPPPKPIEELTRETEEKTEEVTEEAEEERKTERKGKSEK